MNEKTNWLAGALILALGVAAGGFWIGQGVERFRTGDRTVTIKGLAEQAVKSDYAVWTLSFRRGGNDFGNLQQTLAADREQVIAFLKGQGFKDDELDVRPLQVQDLFARDFAQGGVPLRFNGQGRVDVKTARVDAVAAAANKVDPLIKAGVQLTGEGEGASGPRYLLRGFNELKPKLLTAATENAREQATRFTQEAGATLGALKSANQGVIRVLDDDGSDMDSSGQTIGKRLRVVSTFEYSLK